MPPIGLTWLSHSKQLPSTAMKGYQMVSVNLDARVRQRGFAFFFLGAFLLLNIPSKHEIIHSWVPVFGRKKGVELTDSVCFS